MTSPLQIAANCANAKQSTGPRTAGGRQRVSRNAIRHKLSLPVGALPEYDELVTQLTLALVGSNSSSRAVELARRVAEAQVDISRVRILRRNLFDEPLLRLWDLRVLKALVRAGNAPIRVNPNSLVSMPEPEAEIERIATRIAARSRELARLDRYERRALSRRKFAIREMDALAIFEAGELGPP